MFHLWWKENLVKHQKVSKCFDHDCSFKFPNFQCFKHMLKNLRETYKWIWRSVTFCTFFQQPIEGHLIISVSFWRRMKEKLRQEQYCWCFLNWSMQNTLRYFTPVIFFKTLFISSTMILLAIYFALSDHIWIIKWNVRARKIRCTLGSCAYRAPKVESRATK